MISAGVFVARLALEGPKRGTAPTSKPKPKPRLQYKPGVATYKSAKATEGNCHGDG